MDSDVTTRNAETDVRVSAADVLAAQARLRRYLPPTPLHYAERFGCWLKLELNDKETAMVKMKDYSFFLPLAAKGKTVVIDGEVKKKTISVAELKHYADDAKKSKEEIAAITKPEEEVRVTAKGIVVVE